MSAFFAKLWMIVRARPLSALLWLALASLIVYLVDVPVILNTVICRKGQVSRCNFMNVSNGMTIEQVEELLGHGAPWPWLTPPTTNPDSNRPLVRGASFRVWASNDRKRWVLGGPRVVVVGLGEDDRVCDKWYGEPSLWDTIKGWQK